MGTTFDLGVIFRMIDKLSVPMAAMQKKLDKFSEKASKIGKNLEDVGKKMTTFATLPIIGLGAAMIKTASDLEESINKIDVAFGDSAQGIKDWSNTTLKDFGIAKGTALDMAALFGDMSTSMGFTQAAAAEMSSSLVGLAGDIASFKNMNISEVQTALTGVFTGETESLKRLGVVMTDVNLEEYALSQGIKKGIGDMTQSEKVLLRYNYVMKMTANSHGDFKRTSGGAANQMRIFTESLKELAANFGKLILPLFTKVIIKLNKVVQWFGNLSEKTKKTILVILAIIAVIGPLIFVIGKLISIVGMVGQAFQVLRLLLTPQGLIIMGIVVAIIAIIAIIMNWGKITKWFSGIWEKLMEFFYRMPRIFKILLGALFPFISIPVLIIKNWSVIKNFFGNIFTWLWNLFNNTIVQKIMAVIMPFVGLPIMIIKNWGSISDFFINLWNGIVNAFIKAIDFIKDIWATFTSWAMKNPILKWLFEVKPKKPENKAKEKEIEKKLNEEEKKKNNKSLLNMDSFFKNFKSSSKDKNTVFVNVKVTAENGAIATIDQVKTEGNTKKKIISDSNYTGNSWKKG